MTETPKYIVIKKKNNVELRRYSGYIKAEVKIEKGSYRSAIYRGFRDLAGYIFGDNTSNQEISMTSPVQVSEGQKIAMTKPVTVTGDKGYHVSFIMPSKYTMATLPEPKNSAITLRDVEPKTIAAIGFSGFYRKGKVEKAKKRLRNWLDNEGIPIKGEFTAAAYNPPWVPWFLTKNEVMVEVDLV
jgi:hypothetical protein